MDIEQAKASIARFKGHLTRAIDNLKKEIAINGDMANAYHKVNAKVDRLEEYLENLGEKATLPEEDVEQELQMLIEKADLAKDMFKNATTAETQVGIEGNNLDLQATIPTGQTKQSIPKNNIKKPHELDDNATLKTYEEWK